MADNAANWEYSLLDVTEMKKSSRTGTPQDGRSCFELIGADCTVPGGIRPHYGFKRIGYLQGAQEISPIVVHDFDCFDVREGDEGYAYGWVSRVSNGDGTARILVGYYLNSGTAFRSRELASTVTETGKMDVVVSGRFVFVLTTSESPIMFYFDTDVGFEPIVISNPGPGAQPECIAYDQNLGWGGISTTNGAPGRGQIILTTLTPSTSGFWASPPQSDSDPRQLRAGSYAFAFRLYNSKLGRWSALSTISPLNTSDFVDAGSNSSSDSDDTTGVSRYAVLDLLYEKTNAEVLGIDAWDYAIIYRSVRVESAGGTTIAAILHADKLIELSEFEIDTQPVGNFKRVRVWYELDDKELIFQLPYTDSATFEESVPHGSVGLGYEGTLLLSGITGASTTPQMLGQGPNKGLGEMRWSSLVETSPELFPPYNRYVPTTPSNEIVRFIKVTGQAIGFSSDRQYHIRKESIYLRVMEMHEGFGVVGPRAVTSVGSLAYFVTHKGVKVVDPQGQLEALESLDYLVLQQWRNSYLDLEMAYDAASSVLYVLNPTEEKCALVWFNSSSISELYDTSFLHCCEGKFPASNVAGQGNLISRAFFLDEWGRIYTPDYRRSRIIANAEYPGANGRQRYSLMDFNGDGIVRVNNIGPTLPSNTINLMVGQGKVLTNSVGLKVYKVNLDADNMNLSTARPMTITAVNGTHSFDVDDATGINEGDYLMISPVYVRWVGSQLGLQDEDGNTYGPRAMHRVRHVASMQVVCSDVTLPTYLPFSTGHYTGLIYRSNEDTPIATAYPLTRNGVVPTQDYTITSDPPKFDAPFGKKSDKDGYYGVDGTILFPGIQVILTDIDYRILSVRLTGRIRSSERTRTAT